MYDKSKIEWTRDWPRYEDAVIAIAAALAGGGEVNDVVVTKRAFDLADSLARGAMHREPTRLYVFPMAWIREEHDSGKPLSDELLFLWRMAASGMTIPETFGGLVQLIRDMPKAEVSKLASSDNPEALRLAVIQAIQEQG